MSRLLIALLTLLAAATFAFVNCGSEETAEVPDAQVTPSVTVDGGVAADLSMID